MPLKCAKEYKHFKILHTWTTYPAGKLPKHTILIMTFPFTSKLPFQSFLNKEKIYWNFQK